VLPKVREEGKNRNLVEEYFDLVKEIIEESGIQKVTETLQHG
jgi:type III secretory pathway component EscV